MDYNERCPFAIGKAAVEIAYLHMNFVVTSPVVQIEKVGKYTGEFFTLLQPETLSWNQRSHKLKETGLRKCATRISLSCCCSKNLSDRQVSQTSVRCEAPNNIAVRI